MSTDQTTPVAEPLRHHLEQRAKAFQMMDTNREVDRTFYNYDELIATLGEGFAGRPRPAGIARMAPNQCYWNSYTQALRDLGQYYEGYMITTVGGFPLLHAWLVDSEGEVIDLTLPDDHLVGTLYWGVRIDHDVLVETVMRTKTCGIFDADWEHDNHFLIEGWKALSRAGELELV